MNILIATGKLAQKTVRKAVGNEADVLVVDIEIASFITPNLLLSALKGQSPAKHYDIMFLPGLVCGDFSVIEDTLGCRVRLGPKHAYDLKQVLPFIGDVEFSTAIPACELLSDVWREMALEDLRKIEANASFVFELCGVKIGGDSRMKVMGEIVGAVGMDQSRLCETIASFTASGADIIDLGASLDTLPADVKETIKIAKDVCSLPLSIDTLDPMLIETAVESGIDLVLSLNSKNIPLVGGKIAQADIAAVVIPDLDDPEKSLLYNYQLAKDIGIKKIIVDPVLDPIGHGLTDSIVRYHNFHRFYPEVAVFFGAGNITELIDADSVGVNALLCGIAADVGASILFTPEFSDKARGCVSELSTGSRMMVLARQRESSPKDLGLDLLILKEKRRRPDVPVPDRFIPAGEKYTWTLDPEGPFRIGIFHDAQGGGFIVVRHEKATIVGTDTMKIMDRIMSRGLISRMDHASYLGAEIKKAEIALKLKRSYSQDDDI